MAKEKKKKEGQTAGLSVSEIVKNTASTVGPIKSTKEKKNVGLSVSDTVKQTVSTVDAKKDNVNKKINEVKPTTTVSTPNSDGYTLTSKKYGDYDYHDYANKKDYKIYKKDNKSYYYDEKTKQYVDMDTPRMIDPKQDKKELEEAKKQGYKDKKTYKTDKKGNKKQIAPAKVSEKVELETSDLTKEEKKKYSDALIKQEKQKGKELNFVRKSGTGIDALIGAYNNQITNPNSRINEEVIQPISNAGRIYESGKLNNKLALEWYKKMQGKENKVDEYQKEIDNYNKFNQDVASGKVGFVGNTIQNLNTQVESLKQQGIGTTIASLIGAAGGAALGLKSGDPVGGAIKGGKVGAKFGYTWGSTPYMYELEAGNSYKDLKEMGVSDEKAAKVAKAVGAINAAIEGGENVIDLFSFTGAGKLAEQGIKTTTANQLKDQFNEIVDGLGKEEAKKYIKKLYGSEVAEQVLKSYGKNIISEGLEEASQEAVGIAGERYATGSEGINRNVSVMEDLQRIGQAGAAGSGSAVVLGLPTMMTGNASNYASTRFSNIVADRNIINSINKLSALNDVERGALTDITLKQRRGEALTQEDMTTLQFLNSKATALQQQNLEQAQSELQQVEPTVQPTQSETQQANINNQQTVNAPTESSNNASEQELNLPFSDEETTTRYDRFENLDENDKKIAKKLFDKQQRQEKLTPKEREQMEYLRRKHNNVKFPELSKSKEVNKRDYAKYYANANLENFDTTMLDKAKEIVGSNKQGRRTKQAWLDIANNIGLQAENMDAESLKKYAYESFKYAKPNNKDNLNRQGQKYVGFSVQEWVNAVYDGAGVGKKVETRASLQEQLENQGMKVLEEAEANRGAAKQAILDYIEENNLKNPSVEDMMNAVDWYELYDNSDGDITDIRNAENTYREIAQEIYDENNVNKQSLQEQTSPRERFAYKASDNSKIDNLRKSVSQYMDNSKKTKSLVSTIEKVIKDKNYNITFDDTLGKNVNGRINIENGEVSIKLNPNSTRAAEFVLTHEITHAIDTQQMRDLVMNYAKKDAKFNEALQSLKETYGTEDISDEVLADVSGQLFGNQEFINNLSTTKPNIFKRFYNKIVSLANKITGNSNEALFIRDLRNKWETAYREANIETARENLGNETKLSKELDNSSFSMKENNDIRDRAKNEIGTTTNLNEAGYLTDDGEYLDFSGKRQGARGGQRQMDHREISDIYSDNEYDAAEKKYSNMGSATAILQDFISRGNIRLNGTGVEIATAPTQQQYDKLYDYLEHVQRDNGEVFIDLDTESNNRENLEYTDKTSISKMIKDIKNHYANSNNVENNQITQDNKGRTLTQDQQDFYRGNQVVDREGNLLTLYHGTGADFTVFDRDMAGNHGTYYGAGFYLTPNSEGAADYARMAGGENGKVMELYVKMTNPYRPTADIINKDGTVTFAPSFYEDFENRFKDSLPTDWETLTNRQKGRAVRNVLQDNGYDGIINGDTYVAFEPNQVKNANNLHPTDDSDIRYSWQDGKWQTYLEDKFKSNGTKTRLDDIRLSKGVDVATTPQQVINNFQQAQKGKADNKKLRSWVNTSNEATNNQNTLSQADKDAITYEVQSNQRTAEMARKNTDGLTYEQKVFRAENKLNSNQKVTAVDIAEAQMALLEANERGDIKTYLNLQQDIAIMGTELGQAVQAMSMIQRMSPDGQIAMLNKIVNRNQKLGNKTFDGVQMNEELVQKVLDSYDDASHTTYNKEQMDQAVDELKQDIANQMKVSRTEKVNAWRYLSMLGNPKTHIRNVVANVAMTVVKQTKDTLSAVGESAAQKVGLIDQSQRTRSLKRASKDVKALADVAYQETFSKTKDHKYNEMTELESKRKIFNNKALEAVRKFNDAALSAEDQAFKKINFKKSFSNYLTAQGITTTEQINQNPAIVEAAKAFALQEAKVATFNQENQLANKITSFDKMNPAARVIRGAIIPFARTPLNIAKTGLEYTPGLGFVTTYSDFKKAPQNMKGAVLIDGISKQITGSSLALLGYALAKSGILTGSAGDDKEDKFEKDQGAKMDYSIKIGDTSYDLSWLSPSSMPLFVGARMYEILDKQEELNENVIIESLASTLDPLSELSCISSFTQVLKSYNQNGSMGMISDMAKKTGQNYISQFIPTVSSQFARVFDDTKRTTNADRNAGNKFTQETIRQLQYKIPGLRNMLPESTDVFGEERKENENIVVRAIESFLSPANSKKDTMSKESKELVRLYKVTGNDDVLPSAMQKYINFNNNKYDLSSKEYNRFKKDYGTAFNDNLRELMDSDAYKDASDDERADMIAGIMKYAKDKSKNNYLTDQGEEYVKTTAAGNISLYESSKVDSLINDDFGIADYYIYKTKAPKVVNGKLDVVKNKIAMVDTFGIDPEVYSEYLENIGQIKGTVGSNGKTIPYSKQKNVAAYLNSLPLTAAQKELLYRQKYSSYRKADKRIINTIQNSDLSVDEKYALAYFLNIK